MFILCLNCACQKVSSFVSESTRYTEYKAPDSRFVGKTSSYTIPPSIQLNLYHECSVCYKINFQGKILRQNHLTLALIWKQVHSSVMRHLTASYILLPCQLKFYLPWVVSFVLLKKTSVDEIRCQFLFFPVLAFLHLFC